MLSALMRTEPEDQVVDWLDRQPAESVWTTSITVFEARYGIALLPQGGRRKALEQSFARVLQEDLENRILDFDCSAADEAAVLAANRQKSGRRLDFREIQIAGIALSRHATIATRNVRHFQGLKIAVVDPWRVGGR